MDFISLGMGLGSGVAIGAVVGHLSGKMAGKMAESGKLLELSRQLAVWESRSPQLAEREKLLEQSGRLQAEISDLKAQLAASESQRKGMEELRKVAQAEFENAAQKILEQKSRTFSEQTEKNLEGMLKPLKERLVEFEKKVDDTYTAEAKERFALKAEVERLIVLNERMTHETQSLTQALTGQSKTQGDWGELVLERILEASGLREGHEYTLQDSRTGEDGARYRPDVIIQLPENKHIIVDSKVSLKAYDLHCRLEDEKARLQALSDHVASIERHVSDLADKHYAKLKGISSPDFVFMFVPVEPAYLAAMRSDPELATRAWRKNVAIVTSTTLFTALKTVAANWKVANQNRNAQEIAQEGARLYDKFVGFLEDFEKIGKVFEQGQNTYQTALGKLKEGPGNVFRKIERLKELGASPSKQIKAELLE